MGLLLFGLLLALGVLLFSGFEPGQPGLAFDVGGLLFLFGRTEVAECSQ